MTSGIYAIVHRDTARAYVGSARNISSRWYEHQHRLRNGKHHSPYLQNAWNKYGAEAFELIVLEHVEDRSQLVAREQLYLDAIGEFNVSPTAGSTFGFRHSKETIEKFKARPKRKKSADEIERIASFHRGRKRPDETCRRISDALTGTKKRPHQKANNRVLTMGADSHTLTEWSRKLGISKQTILCRIKRGWPIDQVLSKAPDKTLTSNRRSAAQRSKFGLVLYEHAGERLSAPEWGKRIGLTGRSILVRLKNGMSVSKAVTLPRQYRGGGRRVNG